MLLRRRSFAIAVLLTVWYALMATHFPLAGAIEWGSDDEVASAAKCGCCCQARTGKSCPLSGCCCGTKSREASKPRSRKDATRGLCIEEQPCGDDSLVIVKLLTDPQLPSARVPVFVRPAIDAGERDLVTDGIPNARPLLPPPRSEVLI